MLAKRIIPCFDVKEGRIVKGVNFVNLRDAGDPVEVADVYDRDGADELAFLDITATHEERPIIIDVVRRTAERVFMPLTVGGGITRVDDIRALLNAGADKVSINTAAVADPDLINSASDRFGSQCIVVAIDARRCDERVCSRIVGYLVCRECEDVFNAGAGEELWAVSRECEGQHLVRAGEVPSLRCGAAASRGAYRLGLQPQLRSGKTSRPGGAEEMNICRAPSGHSYYTV